MNKLTTIITVFTCLFSPLSFASILEEGEKCTEIKSNKLRLSCFDQLFAKNSARLQQETRTKAQLEAQAKAAAEHALEVKATNEQTFGLKKKTDTEQKLHLIVATVDATPYGNLKLKFKNGQVWKQTDSTRLRLKSGDAVIISRGAFGSFNLKKVTSNKKIKVKRIK